MAAPNPATGVAWDTTSPDNGQPHGNDYNEHHETKLAVAIRSNKEHVAFGATSAGGEHKPGSAVIYFGDFSVSAAGDALPTKRPDAAAPWTSGGTALSSADYGRLAYDTDAVFGGIMYRYTATGWVALGYMALVGEQTIDGTKTFNAFPISPSIAPSSDYQFSNKKYVDDQSDPAFTSADESHVFHGGLIIKQGSVTGAQSNDRTVSFAAAFPTACLNVQLTPQSAAAAGHSSNLQLLSLSAANFHFTQPNGAAAYNLVYWLAIGY